MLDKLPQKLVDRLALIYSKSDLAIVSEGFATEKRPVFFRVNLLKSTCEEVEVALEKSGIPYQKDPSLENTYSLIGGKERDLWNLRIYKDGKIYLQSFSSQLPVAFMGLIFSNRVLDLTAAPGGKTGQISERIGTTGHVVAFENNALRFEKMQHNLVKLDCENVEAIYGNSAVLCEKYEDETFDAILFDAPCSSEGKINLHISKTFDGWDEKYIAFNYKKQKSIIEKAVRLLKKGGILLYSTCTLAPEENEGLVHFLLCNFPELQLEDIDFDYEFRRPGIKKFGKYIYKSEIEKCVRILPNAQSEGFFMAKLKKC